MFCRNCGNKVDDNVNNCPNCGFQINNNSLQVPTKRNPLNAFTRMWKNAFNIKDRTSRSDFWWALVISYFVPAILFTYLGGYINHNFGKGYLMILTAVFLMYYILSFVPVITMSIRRLQDANKSGWLILLAWIPIVNIIIFCLPSVNTNNKYSNKQV